MSADVDKPTRASLTRYVRTMVAAGAAAGFVYLPLLSKSFGWYLFGNFYDVQARALLNGDIAVPKESLGIEAFVVQGHDYMYFPPGPSLLRMPLFAITDRFDDRLTGFSMLLAWVVTTLLVSLLLWRVRCLLRGDAPLGRGEAAACGLFLVSVSAGSVVLFLASIPWVYHEAYAWAIATALGSVFCLLGLIQRPSGWRVVTTGLFTLAAALTRTPAGWACAVAVLMTSAWFLSGRRGEEARRLWWRVALAAMLPLIVAAAVNWAKFGHPFLFPLENQVYTGISQHRRDALAANGGDLVSPDIFFSTVVAYLRPDGIRFVPVFPFITLPSEAARAYGGGFLDQTYRTGSVVAFMPVLVILAVWGVVTAYRPRGPRGIEVSRLPLLAALAIPGAIMFYGYIAHRYTSEFVPLLVIGGAIGLVDIARRLGSRPRRVRIGAVGAMALLVAFSVVANLAVSVHSHAVARPEGRLRTYVSVQEQVSGWTGDPLVEHIAVSDTLPTRGQADELRIIGDCQALYLGTGVDTDPWVPVEIAETALRVGVGEGGANEQIRGRLALGSITGFDRGGLFLERNGNRFRLVLERGLDVISDWFEIEDGESRRVIITPHWGDAYIISAGDGDGVMFLKKRAVDRDLSAVPNTVLTEVNAAEARALGLEVGAWSAEPLELCERLLTLERDAAASE